MTANCRHCRDNEPLKLDITMAFQPILDVSTRKTHAYEALVRGTGGEGAGDVLSRVTDETRYAFDQLCRTTAIRLAADLDMKSDPDAPRLSINFLPNAVYEPRACIRQTLATAMQTGFPIDRIMFEFTENERVDTAHLLNILRTYRSMGFATAIDDFGAGYAGMNLLAAFQPDYVKLDMDLIRGIERDAARQTIVQGILRIVDDLGVTPVCEGIETHAEYEMLRGLGVKLMQGYYLARPETGAFPLASWPDEDQGLSAAG